MLKSKLRLKKTGDFKQIYQNGRYQVAPTVVLYYLKTNGEPRFGFVVSKKVGPSNVRNRTKRLLREVIRHNIKLFPRGYDYVFVARPPVVRDNYSQLTATVARLLKKSRLNGNS